MPRLPLAVLAGLSVLWLAPGFAHAATYRVGPGEAYATIQDTLSLLGPGDIVEVMGDHTYAGDLWFRSDQDGDPGNPVTIRGIAVNGHRPIIRGVGSAQWHTMIVLLNASHFVFEGFEIVGDGNSDHQGIVHKADDVTIRDVVLHGVGGQGLLGTDSESGSLTLERSEFYDNGYGLYDHQIYMATDETAYPGSVFRMQYCYVHDGAGGNNVKSRAERNEIYFNWIEGAVYHELDLIGPDGQDEALAREDSDVVGNVLIKHSEWRIARIGGDGTGNTAGRYRFAHNTMVLGPDSATAITMQQTVESVEMHGNVVVRLGASGGALIRATDQIGPDAILSGSHNFVASGFSDIPSTFTTTHQGASAMFVDETTFDLRPMAGAPIVDQGSATNTSASPVFPSPRTTIDFVPPARALGTHGPRVANGAIDLGAFEIGSGMAPGPGGFTPIDRSGGGCSCRVDGGDTSGSLASFVAGVVGLALLRPRRRRS